MRRLRLGARRQRGRPRCDRRSLARCMRSRTTTLGLPSLERPSAGSSELHSDDGRMSRESSAPRRVAAAAADLHDVRRWEWILLNRIARIERGIVASKSSKRGNHVTVVRGFAARGPSAAKRTRAEMVTAFAEGQATVRASAEDSRATADTQSPLARAPSVRTADRGVGKTPATGAGPRRPSAGCGISDRLPPRRARSPRRSTNTTRSTSKKPIWSGGPGPDVARCRLKVGATCGQQRQTGEQKASEEPHPDQIGEPRAGPSRRRRR